jgi:hypothetical protein
MLIAGVILIAGSIITWILFSRSSENVPASANPATGGIAQVPLEEIPRASVDEAKSAFDSGEAVFVDVRDRDSYDLNHIPGALSIPLSEVGARLGELDPDTWIITYCT